MANRSLNALMERLVFSGDVTPHGMRATFSTYLNSVGASVDVIEHCLAHLPANRVRAAYSRHAYQVERRVMLHRGRTMSIPRYGQHHGIGWLTSPILAYPRKFHNRAQCTMVPTDALRNDLAARGFERLHVVCRGVDSRLFDPVRRNGALRRQWGAGDDDLVLAYVGRLAAEKNLDARRLRRDVRTAQQHQAAVRR